MSKTHQRKISRKHSAFKYILNKFYNNMNRSNPSFLKLDIEDRVKIMQSNFFNHCEKELFTEASPQKIYNVLVEIER